MSYRGKIVHLGDKLSARPFRMLERKSIAEALQSTSAYKFYKNLLVRANLKSLASYNRSGIGTSSSILRKMKWEGHQSSFNNMRSYRAEVISLPIIMNTLCNEDIHYKYIKGFIQLIQVNPLKVICFHIEGGIRLWHDPINKCVLGCN